MAGTPADDHQPSSLAWIESLATITRPRDQSQDRRIGWTIWACLLVTSCIWVTFGPKRSVTPAYFFGAEQWVAGLPLYNHEGIGFLYLPQAAILFAPFAALPTALAEVLWRLMTIGIYAWGVRCFVRLAEHGSSRPLFALTSLVAAPLALSGARNGQATLPMAGMMMAAVAYLATKSWWRAAVCLVVALAIKPLVIVLILLSVTIYRPLVGRLLVALGVMLAIPFLMQDPAYVQSQYAAFAQSLQLANAHSNVEYFAQLFGLLRVVGLDVSDQAQTAWRGAFAILTLVACIYYSRRIEAARWGVYFYALSTSYLMLFNPRTENNTYSMLAPAMAVFFAWAVIEKKPFRTILLGGIILGTLGSFEIGRLVTPKPQAVWLAPLMCVFFSGCVVRDLLTNRTATLQLPAGGSASSVIQA